MPISKDEFNRGETRNSYEEIVYQILVDGNAYSLGELEQEVGIAPKSKDPIDLGLYILNGFVFKLDLDDMVKAGKLVSKEVKTKSGGSNTYYMRKDLLK